MSLLAHLTRKRPRSDIRASVRVPPLRKTMAAMNRSAIESHQLTDWLRHLLQDIELTAWRGERQLVSF